MSQHGSRKSLNIIGRDISPTIQQCSRLSAQQKELHGSWTGSPTELFGDELRDTSLTDPRLSNQRQGVVNDMIAGRNLPNQSLQCQDLFGIENLRDDVRLNRRRSLGNLSFFGKRRVLYEDLEHETVLLRFRQRIGPLLLNWVLCRQHEERISQNVPRLTDGHLSFLHCFEERRLRLGRSSIDFVCKNHVVKQGTRDKPELTFARISILLQNVSPGDVSRHQVRGKLDPCETHR